MTPPSNTQSAPPADRTRPLLIISLLAILGAAHLVTSFSPGINTWSVDYWSSFPVAARFALAAFVILLFSPPVARALGSVVDALLKVQWGRILCLATLGVVFVAFRSRVHVYGDGYSFAGYFAGGRLPNFTGQLSVQTLDLLAHWAVYRAIVMPLGGPVETSYVILGSMAGLLSIWAIVRIARALGSDAGTRKLIVAAGLTSVTTTLWFGYVESYALVNAGILWAIAFALEAEKNRTRIWAAWGMWILSAGFHQLAVVLLPALVWAHWRTTHSPVKELSTRRRVGVLAVGFLAWMAATWVYSLMRPDVFVPLLPTANSTYTAFGWHHLVDVFNLMLLLAPLGVIGLVVWLFDRDTGTGGARHGHGVIAVAAASLWFFTFWVDPLLGAFRDWDLLAGFGIPMSIWGGSVIARKLPRGGIVSHLWVLIGAIAVVHAGAFVATLQSPEGAMMRVDSLVRQDVHYSGDFFHGKRLGPWAAVLQVRFDRNDMAKDHLGRRVELEPSDGQAWANLGGAYRLANRLDSARVCYEHAISCDPAIFKYHYVLGLTMLEQGDNSGARAEFTRGVALADTAYDCRCMIGVACLRLGLAEEAGIALNEAARRYPNRFDAYYYRGAQREVIADTAGALQDYEAALIKGGRLEEVYTRLCQLYQWSGKARKAIEAAHRWEQQFPKSSAAPFLQGTSFLDMKEYDSALSSLDRCLRLKPGDAVATYYMASAYRNLKQPGRARELAVQASRLDSTLALPYLELVYLAADAGDRAAARAATREYLRRSPQDSAMSYLRQFIGP
jgi:tetratricopeptide (TPR) repeat protein